MRGGGEHAQSPSLATFWEAWLSPSVTWAPGLCSCPQHTAWALAVAPGVTPGLSQLVSDQDIRTSEGQVS